MKYDLRHDPDSAEAKAFLDWLAVETTESLRRCRGDAEQAKAGIFLFVNRAYEAHMPEAKIGEMFGICLVRAGYAEEEEDSMLSWLEVFGQVAASVHGCA